MSVFEIHGGPINHRYLMNKSKSDLARMYLELLDVRARELKIAGSISDDYMTSETHHPAYVLIPKEKFDQLRSMGENP